MALLLLAGSPPAVAQLTVDRTVFVPALRNPEDSCANLQAVLSSLPGPRNNFNAYLVKLAPGEYRCLSPVSIPTYVIVEGAGRTNTIINSTVDSTIFGAIDFGQTVNSGLRSLTVINQCTSASCESLIGVSVFNGVVFLEGVRILKLGTANNALGLWVYGSGGNDAFVDVWTSEISFPAKALKVESLGSASATVHLRMSWIKSGSIDTTPGGLVQCIGTYLGTGNILLDPNCLVP